MTQGMRPAPPLDGKGLQAPLLSQSKAALATWRLPCPGDILGALGQRSGVTGIRERGAQNLVSGQPCLAAFHS